MDIAITGSHGLIGSAVAAALRHDGHRVVPVVRQRPSRDERAAYWDPDGGTVDAGALEGLDGVVHLAGAGIASGRWTGEQKRRIRESRTKGTTLLAETLAGLDAKPAVLVSGSAIGIYGGDRGGTPLTERSPLGDDFLAEVCQAWEGSTAAAEEAGIRVAKIRTGVVLSTEGGALAKQLLPFKLGLGGRAGSGRQWFSWITLADEVGAIRFLLDNDLSGPVNLTAPNPVTNATFAGTLASVLGRPSVVPIPRLVEKLPFGVGELAESLLFASQRVEPAVLEAARYPFQHPELRPALEAVLA